MLARNSDLWRLAASSRRLLSSTSWKSRAFWMARADCVAKVLSSWTISGANSPRVLLVTPRTPMTSSSLIKGTPSSARCPASINALRTGLS